MGKSIRNWLVTSIVLATAITQAATGQENVEFETIRFPSADSIEITADLYLKHADKSKPFIVLCHQAGWSRGEYREIAPKLNQMGFNCMAIDQRSGKGINNVDNETMKLAEAAGKGVQFLDAEQDMIAALKHAKKNYADGKLILWGSSYSAALSLRIAGEHTDLVDGALSFAPGEYFARFGKPEDYIQSSAKKIKDPIFVTSAKNEYQRWKAIFEVVSADGKTKFVPETKGNHGSRALWARFDDSGDYWKATEGFLKKFL